jgi:hypothetical protein
VVLHQLLERDGSRDDSVARAAGARPCIDENDGDTRLAQSKELLDRYAVHS